MRISVDTHIPFPRALVYATYRDKLVELTPYMANVRHIEAKSRREKDGQIHCINEWHGGGEIPAIARAVLSEELLSWTEYDVWDESAFTLEWHIETHLFKEAVYCAGKNRFVEDGNATLIESRGELKIDPNQLQAIPPFLTRTIANVIEDVLGKQIEPNLVQMSEGVRRYLE